MKVKYHFNSFDERRMLTAISNLLLYYNDVSMQIRDGLEKLQKESRVRDWLVNQIRKSTGSIGVTVDNVFSSVEAAVAMGDIFWFEVDGVRFCDLLHNKKQLDITFSMNDYYFLTQNAISRFYPGKHMLFRKYPEGLPGEKLKWMDWVDNNWRNDRRIKNTDFIWNVLEE